MAELCLTLCFCVACFVGMQALRTDLNDTALIAEDYASAEWMGFPCAGCGRLADLGSDGGLASVEIQRYNTVLDEAFGREGNLPPNFPWWEDDNGEESNGEMTPEENQRAEASLNARFKREGKAAGGNFFEERKDPLRTRSDGLSRVLDEAPGFSRVEVFLMQIECPCGCGAQMAEDSGMAVALRLHWPCAHLDARKTAAHGVWYCHDCWHWLGSRQAFRALPRAAQDTERWITTGRARR